MIQIDEKQEGRFLKELEKRFVATFGEETEPPPGWEEYPQVGKTYGPRKGCLNEGSSMYNDDTLQGIIELFYEYVAVIRDAVQGGHPIMWPTWLHIVIGPSCEDTTDVVVYLDGIDVKRKIVVLAFQRKAWNFAWEKPEDMAKDMADDYRRMMEALKERGA